MRRQINSLAISVVIVAGNLLAPSSWAVEPVKTQTISPAKFDLTALEEMPIQAGGRRKPFYTFSVETLTSLSGREYYTNAYYGKIGPVAAVVSMWLAPEAWHDQPVILLNLKGLKEALGLDPKQKRFSYDQLSGTSRLRELIGETLAVKNDPAKPKLSRLQKEVETVAMRLLLFEGLTSGNSIALVPNPEGPNARWAPPSAAPGLYPGPLAQSVPETVARMKEEFEAANTAGFNQSVKALADTLAKLNPSAYPPGHLLRLEVKYEKTHPFGWAWKLYLAAALVLALTSLGGRRTGYALGWILALGGFGVQVAGFVCRILIAGRAPVTNMYESVIWVAFGAMLFALILEAIYRCRYFLLAGCPAAVVFLILADTQPAVLDSSINPLVPVLRDNFWLSTHVTSITLSYAAFLLALAVAHIALGKVLMGRRPTAALYLYLYRALQIGVLLLAIGTVLGGVWANYSWGRFWDWDPKETWALITLLCYLALLHGRIVGWWNGFGLAVGSVIGFLSVLMAWYGVNFVLGEGLHSYGFGTGGKGYVVAVCVAELVFAGFAILARRRQGPDEPEPPAEREVIAA